MANKVRTLIENPIKKITTHDAIKHTGMVTIGIGLVSKHGVLITQFANERVKSGMPLLEAVVEAAAIRLRPILMTTATMVLGALPLLFATGSGAQGRVEIGLVIVAGLLFGTLFSLFIVPVAYTLFAKLRIKHLN
jgi:multidrug efflux pump subunit AcrB